MTLLPRVVVSQVKHNSWFVAGVAAGLWLALAVPLGEPESCSAPAAPRDEFAPVRGTRPAGPAAAARSVQRPRYYTTELGIRAPLLAGVLSSEDMLESRVAALNQTAGRLQPVLRFFMSASALGSAAPRANVVAFTDTREMLKPFHALKYLADNYLDDYNFFFLTSDTAWVNARRLAQLVSRLSVSEHLHMGVPADDDSHYCSLEGGILLSNSVLRLVHAQLDWCVRNSYSPRHHENLGRCVLHAARRACTPHATGERYTSVDMSSGELRPELADAVTARGAAGPRDMHRLHAYVSRVYLERYQQQVRQLVAATGRLRRRSAPQYRRVTWPPGLRHDPAVPDPAPDTRFDHLRWTAFNATHAWLPDDRHTVAPIPRAHREALQLVWERAQAWAQREWSDAGDAGDAGAGGGRGTRDVRLVEGAWRWEPPRALRYRLLVHTSQVVRQLEVVRPLGAARLAPVPYVTESVRVTLVVPVTPADGPAAARLVRDAAGLRDAALCVVAISPAAADRQLDWSSVLGALPPAATLLHATEDAAGLTEPGRLSLAAARGRLAPDALVLLLHPRAQLNDDFLNRVRMNTISGSSWYLPVPYARYLAPSVSGAGPTGPARARPVRTGGFSAHRRETVAFYKRDFDDALASWRGNSSASVSEILAASRLRVLSAPDPALVLSPSREPPCRRASETGDGASASASETACLRDLAGRRFAGLQLGAAADLARLVLDRQASPAA